MWSVHNKAYRVFTLVVILALDSNSLSVCFDFFGDDKQEEVVREDACFIFS
jgi:hypothetical protein